MAVPFLQAIMKKLVRYRSDMTANNTEWDEEGTTGPDWTPANWVTLDGGGALDTGDGLTSILPYQSGILIADVNSNDWLNCQIGFYRDAGNYIMVQEQSHGSGRLAFESRKNTEEDEYTDLMPPLENTGWYQLIIYWTATFCRVWWVPYGAPFNRVDKVTYVTHYNSPELPMNIRFKKADGTGGALNIAQVTLLNAEEASAFSSIIYDQLIHQATDEDQVFSHPKKVLYTQPMDANPGDWQENGVTWFALRWAFIADLNEYIQHERYFRYVVCSFNILSADWANTLVGWYGESTADDYCYLRGQTLYSRKHRSTAKETPLCGGQLQDDTGLARSWYHVVMIWTPELVRVEIYRPSGGLAAWVQIRNPPEVPMSFQVWALANATNIRFAHFTIQEGDLEIYQRPLPDMEWTPDQQQQLTHPKRIKWHSTLDSNSGGASDDEDWIEVGSPSWASDEYVELSEGESITSARFWRYGQLTFNAWADDWTDVILGFLEAAENYVEVALDNFVSEKHDTAQQSTALGLTDSTWYHFIIEWNPKFVEVRVYELDGDLVVRARHRNPPNVNMQLYFESGAGLGALLRVAALTLCEGDDPSPAHLAFIEDLLVTFGGVITDTDDDSVAAAQTPQLVLPIPYGYDPEAADWKRQHLLDAPDEHRMYQHRKTLLYESDMDANNGEWTETGTPDWTSADYVQLLAGEAITSIRTYRYGVLTFNLYADATALVNFRLGFGDAALDRVMLLAQNFNTIKHSSGIIQTPITTVLALTWHHVKIIWCPQFCSIQIHTADGNLVAQATHGNPPERRLPLYFFTNAGIAQIGGVTVQEADDPAFFETEQHELAEFYEPETAHELRPRTHPKRLLFTHDMNANQGAWTETGTPDWTNAHYVTLIQGEILNSVKQFRYGVLTLNAYSTDWSFTRVGFYTAGDTDYVMVGGDNFYTKKQDLAPALTFVQLTASKWYHIIITWCPQFVSVKVYDTDGDLVASGQHRTPSIRLARVLLQSDAGMAQTLQVGMVTVQEADSDEFFQEPPELVRDIYV